MVGDVPQLIFPVVLVVLSVPCFWSRSWTLLRPVVARLMKVILMSPSVNLERRLTWGPMILKIRVPKGLVCFMTVRVAAVPVLTLRGVGFRLGLTLPIRAGWRSCRGRRNKPRQGDLTRRQRLRVAVLKFTFWKKWPKWPKRRGLRRLPLFIIL